MSEKIKYNGWSNYATWVVNLWLNNDRGTYLIFMDEVKRIKEKPEYIIISPEEKILRKPEARLADFIKNWIDDYNPLIHDASLYHDVITHALAFVNYQEIAKGFLEG